MQSVFLGHTDEPFTFIYKGKYAVQVTKHSAYVDAIVENLCQSGVTAHNFTPNSPIAGWLTIEKTTTCEDVTLSDVQAEIRTFLQGVGLANIGMQSGELTAPWYEALAAYMPPPPTLTELFRMTNGNAGGLAARYSDGSEKLITLLNDTEYIMVDDGDTTVLGITDCSAPVTFDFDDVESMGSDVDFIGIQSVEWTSCNVDQDELITGDVKITLADGNYLTYHIEGVDTETLFQADVQGFNINQDPPTPLTPEDLVGTTPTAMGTSDWAQSVAALNVGQKGAPVIFNSVVITPTLVQEGIVDFDIWGISADNEHYQFTFNESAISGYRMRDTADIESLIVDLDAVLGDVSLSTNDTPIVDELTVLPTVWMEQ